MNQVPAYDPVDSHQNTAIRGAALNGEEWAKQHPEMFAWLQANCGNPSFTFPDNMLIALRRFGGLTGPQVAAIQRCMDSAHSRKASTSVDVSGMGFTKLIEAFRRAKASKLKYPALVFERITFKLAGDKSRNAGNLYVTRGREYGSQYFGRISPDGKFYQAEGCPSEITDEIKRIGADPLGMAVAHGKRTGNCCACGRGLEDAKSVELGIGPVCRKKWFAL